MKLYNNIQLNREAHEHIADGALTNSKRPQSLVKGVYPTHMERGYGCTLFDVDGNRFTDFICGLGTNLFGYANPHIASAVTRAMMSGGSVFSLGSREEVVFARRIKEVFPFLDLVRFLKTGSEGCTAAIKIARAYHGVKYDNQDVQEMWFREGLERIWQGQEHEGWPSKRLQAMYPRLSKPATGEGGREGVREKTLADRQRDGQQHQKEGSGQTPGPGQNLSSGEAGGSLRGTHQEFVRSMWERELTSPSPRLQQAPSGGMAMSGVSHQGARWLILSDGYHGHHDEFVSLTTPANGVPLGSSILPLTGNEGLIPIAAGVIIEPVIVDMSDNRRKYLQDLRDLCTKNGTILIFDETITAYRFPEYSVARHFNILPDLFVAGKALGGGLPLSVVGGRRDVMDADYFVSSTWAGDRLALAAGSTAIDLLHGDFSPETLWVYGEEFLSRFNAISPDVQIEGYPTRGVFKYSSEKYKTLFMQEMCKAGILIGPSWFYNKFLHDEIQNVISIATAVVKKINQGKVVAEGPAPVSPVAEKVRRR